MILFRVLLANVLLLAPADEPPIQDRFDNEVKTINSEKDFKAFVDSNERTIVLFSGSPCPVCKIAEDVFENFMQESCKKLQYCNGGTILGKANTEDWKDIGKRFDLTGYPSVHYYQKGELKKKYMGFRTWMNETKELVRWVKKREVLMNVMELPKNSHSPGSKWPENSLVAHVSKKSARQKAVYEAVDSLSQYDALDTKFAVKWLPKGSDPKADAKLRLMRSYFRDAERKDGESIEYEGTWTANKIAQWIKDNSYPIVGRRYSGETYGPWGLEEMGWEASVVAVTEDKLHVVEKEKKGTLFEEVEDTFAQVASDYPKWKFSVVSRVGQGTHVVSGRQLEQLGGKKYSEDVYSEPWICVLMGKKKYVLEGSDDIKEVRQVKQFLENVQRGNLRPTYKSELTAPEGKDADGAIVLTGANFADTAFDAKKNVLVLFTSSPDMCKECKEWVPVWSKLGKMLKSSVVMARMNPTLNECEEDTESFPKLVMYPAVAQKKKMKKRQVFGGKADLDEVIAFVESMVEGSTQEL